LNIILIKMKTKYLRPNIGNLPKVEIVTVFKKDDILCHENNYLANQYHWFMATAEEVKTYSGKNGNYYKIINPKEFTTN